MVLPIAFITSFLCLVMATFSRGNKGPARTSNVKQLLVNVLLLFTMYTVWSKFDGCNGNVLYL